MNNSQKISFLVGKTKPKNEEKMFEKFSFAFSFAFSFCSLLQIFIQT
jgi:hypothetical protein